MIMTFLLISNRCVAATQQMLQTFNPRSFSLKVQVTLDAGRNLSVLQFPVLKTEYF